MDEISRARSRESIDLKKGEFGYPNGHLGHLSEAQKASLTEFKTLVEESGLYTEAHDGKPASHSEVTLLRFLRARRFVPKDALQQFTDTEKWRKSNEIDNLYLNIDIEEYDQTRRLYPQWTGRRDKRGLPVYVFEVAPLNSKTMSAYAKSSKTTTVINSKHDQDQKSAIPPRLYRLFALYENLTDFIMPLCTNLRDRPVSATPVSQSNNIVDISKVGLKQFWNLRNHMQDASVLATAHYPETLDRIFIVGAPGFFPTVWEWIKRWFDPITVSKIFILSEHNAYKTLATFIRPEDIPQRYGGQLPFVFGDDPVLEKHISDRLEWKEGALWPKGPMKWVQREDGRMDFLAVGSVDGKERREVLATLTPDPLPTESVGRPSIDSCEAFVDAEETSVAPAENKDSEANGDPSAPPGVIPVKTDSVSLAAMATALPQGTMPDEQTVVS